MKFEQIDGSFKNAGAKTVSLESKKEELFNGFEPKVGLQIKKIYTRKLAFHRNRNFRNERITNFLLPTKIYRDISMNFQTQYVRISSIAYFKK